MASDYERLRLTNWVLMTTIAVLFVILFWPAADSSPAGSTTLPHQVSDTPQSGKKGSSLSSRPSNAAIQSALPPRKLAAEEVDTIAVFKASAPSVVHITTHRVQRDFFSMNVEKIPRGSGTGFVWDDAGHVVTNYHVIKDADIAHVTFGDQKSSSARLVGAAPDKDLAVLKVDVDPTKLQPLPLGTSSDLEVGLKALAIGNPFGLDQTLTTGIVSALGREIESTTGLPIKDVIQTDAAINPGNSGGPLLDSSGNLIGVNTAIFSPSGAYAGIGFAIPVDVVKWVVPELIQHGRIIRPGIAVGFASDRLNAQLGIPGVLILDVKRGSQAAAANLRPTRRTRSGQIVLGDIIVAIDGSPIRSNKDLVLTLENYEVGERVTLLLWRDGNEVEAPVNLEVAD